MHFIYVLTLSEISKTVHPIGRRYFLIDRNVQQIYFEVSRWLDQFSIPIRSIERQIRSIERNSWSIEKLKIFFTKSQVNLIDSRFLFYQSKGTFNQSKEILDRSKLVKLKFFQIFLVTVFYVLLEQNIVSWSYHNEIEIKTKFYWCYSLKVQSNILNIKLKQHHNINISFYQTIISITMQKIDCIIF